MKIMNFLLFLLTILLLPLALDAQTAMPDRNATPQSRLLPGTIISLNVEDEAQLTTSYTVDANGAITLTMDDGFGGHQETWTVSLQGKTAHEAGDAITESLKRFVKMPQVMLVITRLPRLKIEISGPVAEEGVIELPLGSHMSDAVIAARCKTSADFAKVTIIRQIKPDAANPAANGKTRIFVVDYEAYLKGDSDDDTALENGDKVIFAARPEVITPRETQYVRVIGEVNREVAIPVTDGMTVREALEKAGGLLITADHEKVRLIRGTDGRYLEINADEAMHDNPVHNLKVGPKDLIIVGKRDQSQIYSIGGEVNEPKTLVWKAGDKTTLTQAIEQAGGVTKKADRKRGVLRKGYLRDPNQTRMIVFDLDLIMKKKQADFDIEAGDDIYLPPKQHRPSLFQQIAPLLMHFLPFGI